MKQALKDYILAWYEKADHDLTSAQRLIEIAPPILDTACFHLQQSVEKDLKAFLVYHNVDIERTHNIDRLLKQCAAIDNEFAQIDSKDITSYAVDSRYPDHAEMPELSEAQYYYQLALDVKSLVRNKVKLDVKLLGKKSKKSLLSKPEKKTILLPKKAKAKLAKTPKKKK